MSDAYLRFVQSGLGRSITRRLGLPQPAKLDRYSEGAPFLLGPTLLAAAKGSLMVNVLRDLTQHHANLLVSADSLDPSRRLKAVIYDASGIASAEELGQLHRFFGPIIKSFGSCTRVVVIGCCPKAGTASQGTAQRALLGFVKALAKEMRSGGTVNLIECAGDCRSSLAAPLAFFASDRSAYVSGQSLKLTSVDCLPLNFVQPLEGRNILITGAARGIGRAIAEMVGKRGAVPICVDVPQAEKDLCAVASRLGNDWMTLDITAADAADRIADHFRQRPLHGIVHNAGITRDKKLVNMRPELWDAVMRTNLICQETINETLMSSGVLAFGSQIVSISSISGIAGNAGQTNYSTSKAGVIGMVESYADEYRRKGITINAVAPGFIETKMVETIPLALRQAGRRFNSLSQGGLPEDVAEAVCLFLQPTSQGLNGNILRVCGQALMGA